MESGNICRRLLCNCINGKLHNFGPLQDPSSTSLSRGSQCVVSTTRSSCVRKRIIGRSMQTDLQQQEAFSAMVLGILPTDAETKLPLIFMVFRLLGSLKRLISTQSQPCGRVSRPAALTAVRLLCLTTSGICMWTEWRAIRYLNVSRKLSLVSYCEKAIRESRTRSMKPKP